METTDIYMVSKFQDISFVSTALDLETESDNHCSVGFTLQGTLAFSSRKKLPVEERERNGAWKICVASNGNGINHLKVNAQTGTTTIQEKISIAR